MPTISLRERLGRAIFGYQRYLQHIAAGLLTNQPAAITYLHTLARYAALNNATRLLWVTHCALKGVTRRPLSLALTAQNNGYHTLTATFANGLRLTLQEAPPARSRLTLSGLERLPLRPSPMAVKHYWSTPAHSVWTVSLLYPGHTIPQTRIAFHGTKLQAIYAKAARWQPPGIRPSPNRQTLKKALGRNSPFFVTAQSRPQMALIPE